LPNVGVTVAAAERDTGVLSRTDVARRSTLAMHTAEIKSRR
jgi:hypothetical protein